jgi:hypothetical protein
MTYTYGESIVHVLISLFGVCLAAFLVCAYADGDFSRWCDRIMEEWSRFTIRFRRRV